MNKNLCFILHMLLMSFAIHASENKSSQSMQIKQYLHSLFATKYGKEKINSKPSSCQQVVTKVYLDVDNHSAFLFRKFSEETGVNFFITLTDEQIATIQSLNQQRSTAIPTIKPTNAHE